MATSYRALVIDDEASIRGLVAEILRGEGWEVFEAEGAESAFRAMDTDEFDLVFSDVMLGGASGYEILKRFVDRQPEARFVVMTGHGSAAGALDATAIGAFDYLVKPFSVNDIVRIAEVVGKHVRRRRSRRHSAEQVADDDRVYRSDIPLVGKSPQFVECLKMVGRVAPTNLSVLITGESGTGKEIVAQAIHRRSARAGGPFVAVNCGALPVELIESELFGHAKGSFTGAALERAGLWEEARGGTLFLDEITETPPQFQVKVLRALQEGEIRRVGSNKTLSVDVRVLGATNRDIDAEVAAGRFRQDLMFRLNAVTIHLPPLRERGADIRLLAETFAAAAAPRGTAPIRFSPEAFSIMENYDWPGNVRELENAVQHAVSLANDVVYPENLPERIRRHSASQLINTAAGDRPAAVASAGAASFPTLAQFEARYVAEVLDHTGGNKQAAARILDIDRKTLSRIVSRAERSV